MSEFIHVNPGDPNREHADMSVSSVPAVVAYLGLAILDAIRSGDITVTETAGALYVVGDVWNPRPRLLAELARAGVDLS